MHAHTFLNIIKQFKVNMAAKRKAMLPFYRLQTIKKIFKNSIDMYYYVCYSIYRKGVKHETYKYKTIRSGC